MKKLPIIIIPVLFVLMINSVFAYSAIIDSHDSYHNSYSYDSIDNTKYGWAQSFTASHNFTVTNSLFDIAVRPTINLCYIWSRIYYINGVYGSNSKPNGTVIGTSTPILIDGTNSSILYDGGILMFTFPTQPQILAGKYAVSVEWNGTGSVSSGSIYILRDGWNYHSGDTSYLSTSWVWTQYVTTQDLNFVVMGIESIGSYAHASFNLSSINSPHIEINDIITFDGTSSLADIQITSYQWNFGDGNTTTGNFPTITHQYDTNGTKTVSLTVSSNGYSSTAYSVFVVYVPYQIPEITVSGGGTDSSDLAVFAIIAGFIAVIGIAIFVEEKKKRGN